MIKYCRLLRPGNTADTVPAAGRQPVFRLCHHRSQRTVLPQQRIQIHRPAKLRHTDCHRCGSRRGGSVRSRIVCAGHRAHSVGHPDFRGLHTTLSAAPEAYVGAGRVAPDILLLCLPVPVQHHQLLQPEPRQTTNRQVHGNVSPGLL